MKKKNVFIVGNWKLNPDTLESAKSIYLKVNKASQKAKKVTVIACPPALYIPALGKVAKKHARIGAQDAFFEQSGSFTGTISPLMLKNAGAEYVILGHSEKREQGDTDELIGKKVKAALSAGLKPIICVGEKVRDAQGQYLSVVQDQILKIMSGISRDSLSKIIFAYEPVWAIGKNYAEAMKPPDVHEMSLYVKKILSQVYPKDDALSVPVLYGGSVNFENAQPILALGEVSGLLIGRQSLEISEFSKIIAYANELN